MDSKKIGKILSQTAYIRTGGSAEEKRCAEYIKSLCGEMGLNAKIEPFQIEMFETNTEKLSVDGEDIPCKGYYGSPSNTVCGKLYYLDSTDSASLKRCRERVVITDKPINEGLYDKLSQSGAVGIITYNGNINMPDNDIDVRQLGFCMPSSSKIPVVNIHISKALELVKKQGKICELSLMQSKYIGESQNVVLDIKGENEKTILISAHYDSTSLSTGAYDNMSGCITLLYLANYFSNRNNKYTIRLLWCGSEERGLIGSLEYCKSHETKLRDIMLNINLDMIGSVMGEFTAFSCADEKMEEVLRKFLQKHHFGGVAKHQIRSSDSNSFVYFGVPAVSFARYAPASLGQIHTRYDTLKILSAKSLLKDSRIIGAFVEYLQQNLEFLEAISISDKIKTDVENYMQRKAYPSWIRKDGKKDG